MLHPKNDAADLIMSSNRQPSDDDAHVNDLVTKNYGLIVTAALLVSVIGLSVTADREGWYWELAEHTFFFLGAGVVTHLVYHLLVSKYDQVETHRKTFRAINDTADRILPAMSVWGFEGFRQPFDCGDLLKDMVAGDELWWLDTYTTFRDHIGYHLREALKRGVKIRMLAVDPACEIAAMRAREVDPELIRPDTWLEECKTFVEDMKFRAGQAPNLFEVRLYHDLPCMPMYLHVKKEGNGWRPVSGVTSFFLRAPSNGFVHMEWNDVKSGGMLHHFFDYFVAKWASHDPAANAQPANVEGGSAGSAASP